MFKTEKSKIKIAAHDKQVVRTDDALPKTPLIWIICGRKGSGKTSIMLTSLKEKVKNGGYKKYFDNVFMISPTGARDKKLQPLVSELQESGNFFELPAEEIIRDIMSRIKQFNSENEGKNVNNLLIIDDCMNELPTSLQRSATLNNLFILSRHYKLSIIVTTQKYTGLPRTLRTQADLISFFRTDNKKELKSLKDDVNVDDDTLDTLYNFATDGGKNSFLHINMLSNPVSYFKNFDKILL